MSETTTEGASGSESKALAKQDKAGTVLALLSGQDTRTRLAEVATRHLTPEKLLRLVTSEIRRVPDLGKCSSQSLLLAVMNMARLGLEPGGALGHCYLVPFRDKDRGLECQLIIGWRGLVALARRSGVIRRLEAHPVHANDLFVCEFGTDPKLIHTPALAGERGEIVAAYAVAQLADGAKQVEVMTRAEIDKVRASAKSRNSPAWSDWFSEMARKTVVRRLCKYLPLTAEAADPMREALEIDNEDFEEPVVIPNQRKTPPSLREALGMETTIEMPESGEG